MNVLLYSVIVLHFALRDISKLSSLSDCHRCILFENGIVATLKLAHKYVLQLETEQLFLII